MIKEEIRNAILEMGADVCGFAGKERFGTMPAGFAPTDIYSDCKSAIVTGVAIPKGLYEINPRLVYNHFNCESKNVTDNLLFRAAKLLEYRFGITAVPLPCDGPYDAWNPETLTGHGIVSVKHMAVCAGIGTLGKNSMLLNPQFGNRLTVGVVLINFNIESDPLAEKICIEGCHRCIDACPVKAIDEAGDVNQQLCRPNTYETNSRGFEVCNCNNCRTVCPVRFGKTLT